MSHNITVESGKSVKLKTAGKYCDRDIVVTAEGGSGTLVCELESPAKDNDIGYIKGLMVSYPNATVIEDGAFLGLDGLKSIEAINVTDIGTQSFALCSSLMSADFPKATSIGTSCFTQCKELISVNLANVTHVGDLSFNGCNSLESIDLPNATSIGEMAFNECTSLSRVNIPIATNIESGAFRRCMALPSIELPNVTLVGNEAFYFCTSLVSITLPMATTIDTNAFRDCMSLTVVDLPSTTTIHEFAFYGCTKLRAVILRTTKTVCNIDVGAFMIEHDENLMPTILNDKFYIPTAMYEYYRSAYEPAFEGYGFGGYFDIVFHKIEDYPEICG